MPKDILEKIIEKRKEAIATSGYTFGYDIPQKRYRDIHPFISKKCVILEIKRASPSKGDIALDLDAEKTAIEYAKAGAGAISCLTESTYFKGNLDDLMSVAKALDSYASKAKIAVPALLRKDFLIDENDIDVSYRAGADAVLLIARILDTTKIVSMAKRCEELGISMLIEVRKMDDLDKLKAISDVIKDKNLIVCGVNARDLSDFSIDLLYPTFLSNSIRTILGENAKIVFESGIRSAEASKFASSLGFSALLLGEAAARNPENAFRLVHSFVCATKDDNSAKWNKVAKRLHRAPLTKICGITNTEDALKAAQLGADFIGFIFSKKSKRAIVPFKVPEIIVELEKAKLRDKVFTVAVITELDSEEARLAFSFQDAGAIDFIQIHDCAMSKEERQAIEQRAHYYAVGIASDDDLEKVHSLRHLGEPRVLIDAKVFGKSGGTGLRVDTEIVSKLKAKSKLWLAGGINAENVRSIIEDFSPELIDVSSGVESDIGKKDFSKLTAFFSVVNEIKAAQ